MMQIAIGPLNADELTQWYAVPTGRMDWVRASFITTLDGRVTGADGLSGALNADSAADHVAFHHIRKGADAVIVGAGTVRAEGYTPLDEGFPLVVVTRTGALPESIEHADARAGTGEVVVVGGEGQKVEPAEILRVCHARGWRHLVLEGGPQLLGDFVSAGLVDELCLTVRPVLRGGPGPTLLPSTTELSGLLGEATHLLAWDGDLLLRTALVRQGHVQVSDD